MSRKTVVTLLVLIIILLILAVTALLVDLNQSFLNDEPRFCVNTNIYNDGNTKEYTGFGYKIIRYNIDTADYVVKFGSILLQYDESLESIKTESKKDTTVYSIIGKVTEIEEDSENNNLYIYVQSTNSKSIYTNAKVLVTNETDIQKEGLKIKLENIVVGSSIKVKFDGKVTMSIPPQALAEKIEFLK